MDQSLKRTWLGRHWKWVIPVGCLTPLLLCAGGITLIFMLVFGALKSSDVYTEALARAKASEEVQALLGTPIKEGFWVGGSLEVSDSSGEADLAIPISGPKGSATIYVVATKSAGRWEFLTLEVAVEGRGARINLRSEAEAAPATGQEPFPFKGTPAAFSPGGKRLASGGYGDTVKIGKVAD